jgi:PKD repeat protein
MRVASLAIQIPSIAILALSLCSITGCGNKKTTAPVGDSPAASFTVDPTSGTTSTVFEFDASGSTDAEDPVSALQVRWDWENDGTWDTDYSTTKTANHVYATAGTKTVKLEVRDTSGLTDMETHTVTVTGPNTAPAASFTVEPASGTIGTTFQVDASGSSDEQDPVSALEVRWDWDNDGTWETEYSTTKTASHQYATVGTMTVMLEVRDTGGLTSTETHEVTVTVPNSAPTACFEIGPVEGTTATVFGFDATCSADAEDPDSALEVRWDWEDDGAWDTAYSTTKAAAHQYSTAGTKRVKLEVRDPAGLTGTVMHTVTVN